MMNLTISLVIASLAGVNYLLPFFLWNVRGFTVSDAGMILTSLSIGMMITGIFFGFLFNKIGGKILPVSSDPFCCLSAIISSGT
ncbi:MAG: hypothetical protein LBU24_03185 [Methanocalculaceae archaeon]|jgi:MFS family permease|nr:hypothetical protein [Methanocalculaceae archaeon]